MAALMKAPPGVANLPRIVFKSSYIVYKIFYISHRMRNNKEPPHLGDVLLSRSVASGCLELPPSGRAGLYGCGELRVAPTGSALPQEKTQTADQIQAGIKQKNTMFLLKDGKSVMEEINFSKKLIRTAKLLSVEDDLFHIANRWATSSAPRLRRQVCGEGWLIAENNAQMVSMELSE
ncbi:hypothetical protein RRG08_020794 [Elysia crispata]|uniref:Uncharacterized protein n=1 Tax=Elysia crispata TaxID=231223 RepID=A0AAE1DLY4_9GAST|nr:hypothetical protein RRG08_020794 [Elysia crispata]